MSIVACTDCGCYIDSDKHPECFDENHHPHCSTCARGEPYSLDKANDHYSKQVEEVMRNWPYDDNNE